MNISLRLLRALFFILLSSLALPSRLLEAKSLPLYSSITNKEQMRLQEPDPTPSSTVMRKMINDIMEMSTTLDSMSEGATASASGLDTTGITFLDTILQVPEQWAKRAGKRTVTHLLGRRSMVQALVPSTPQPPFRPPTAPPLPPPDAMAYVTVTAISFLNPIIPTSNNSTATNSDVTSNKPTPNVISSSPPLQPSEVTDNRLLALDVLCNPLLDALNIMFMNMTNLTTLHFSSNTSSCSTESNVAAMGSVAASSSIASVSSATCLCRYDSTLPVGTQLILAFRQALQACNIWSLLLHHQTPAMSCNNTNITFMATPYYLDPSALDTQMLSNMVPDLTLTCQSYTVMDYDQGVAAGCPVLPLSSQPPPPPSSPTSVNDTSNVNKKKKKRSPPPHMPKHSPPNTAPTAPDTTPLQPPATPPDLNPFIPPFIPPVSPEHPPPPNPIPPRPPPSPLPLLVLSSPPPPPKTPPPPPLSPIKKPPSPPPPHPPPPPPHPPPPPPRSPPPPSSSPSVTIVLPGTGATSSTSYGLSTTDVAGILTLHNTYRANYQAPPLVWSTTLAQAANNWATRCIFEHSPYHYGENLAEGYGGATQMAGLWYSWECCSYNYSNPGFTAGHFTQMVWLSTTSIGCAMVGPSYACPSITNPGAGPYPGANMLVCEYDPPGNIVGEWSMDVLTPLVPPICSSS
ncbi:hypothetical protein CEUSTIGMA_g1799.t1 [Chlamydomonas eustigma]|uniref:SCP domain-containing protein n=1 Tax=Chlamydomonas eustigma TaxID=1157962 RepID=A0A250WUY2_9CHLO|nr:hypothetical protein CEUSTIGMA_g1799.t1 [Chlamydomonas eustigma]|eukprot:GAX74350.1 hypothetical protein CEUSTIGMA_g1799.t1 [Chlamydomonas eustigma]